MDFIKKFIEEFKTPPEGKVEYTILDVASPDSFWKFTEIDPADSYFTQAEKNYLQRLIADKINEQEDIRNDVLLDAKHYKKHNSKELSKKMFKFHRAIKADIKKLVALQKKIKHTLATWG